jgi:Lon protease-like protein
MTDEPTKPNGDTKAMTPQQQVDAIQASMDSAMAGHLHPLAVGLIQLNRHVPGPALLLSMAGALAKIIGGMYVGDEKSVAQFRRQVRVRFASELSRMPISPLPTAQPAPPPQAAPSTAAPESAAPEIAEPLAEGSDAA